MTKTTLLIAGLALAAGACTSHTVQNTPSPTTAATTTAAAEVLVPSVAENAAELLATCTICDVADYSGPLEPEEAQGLLLALNDEYHAEAVYQQVLDDYGDETRPFSNIIVAEQRHQTSLLDLFATYQLAVPDNPWPGTIDGFDTLEDACIAGVEAEMVNASLYDYLYSTTDRSDVTAVYERLQAASNDKHLPAFERCGGGTTAAASVQPRQVGRSRQGGAGRTG